MCKKSYFFVILFICFFITNSVVFAKNNELKSEKAILKELKTKDEFDAGIKSEIQNARPQAIRETATILATQKGVSWRYKKILDEIKNCETQLSQIFDFGHLLIHKGKVLPPVIVQAKEGYTVESDVKATSVKTVYKIIQDAKFISSPPNWRDYLLQSYTSFSKNDVQVGVLPKNDKEREIWEKAIDKGWDAGVRQANYLFQINLNQLVRDYRGLIKFNILLEKNMVDLPIVAEGELGIKVGDKRLDVDQKVFRITNPTNFKEVENWKPQIGAKR